MSEEESVFQPGPSFSDLRGDLGLTVQLVQDSRSGSAEAVLGYLLALGDWQREVVDLDVGSRVDVLDRAAFGLIELGIAFERHDVAEGRLRAEMNLATFDALLESGDFDAAAILAGAAEVASTAGGRLATSQQAKPARLLSGLAAGLGIETEVRAPYDVWLVNAADVELLAATPVLCASPLLGVEAGDCFRNEALPQDLLAPSGDQWLAATTGPLGAADQQNAEQQNATSAEGGVTWTNNEAQAYVAANVSFEDGIELTVRQRDEADVAELPFESGMVISTEAFGYGTFRFNIEIPSGTGVWPAAWLLDAQACESPGRCPGYGTSSYHEIDVFETSGSEPATIVTSVHWFDESLQSLTNQFASDPLHEGEHSVELQRRPGLLVWLLDGQEIARVADRVEPTTAEGQPSAVLVGPHRDQPMRLILNVAVGGTYAGDRLIGRSGGWWGDASVPKAYPNLGWSTVQMRISAVSFEPLT